MEFIRPLPFETELVRTSKILDVQDKEGKGCVVHLEDNTYQVEKDGSRTLCIR